MSEPADTAQLRLLHIYSSVSDGGGAVSVAQTLTALSERGHLCHLACRPDARIRSRIEGTQCRFHTLPLRNALDIRSLISLCRLVRDHQVGLVHAHNGRDYPMALVVGKFTRTPCVFSRHYYRMNRNPLTRAMFRRVDLVLAVTRILAKKMIDELRVDPKRVQYVPNWITPRDFTDTDALRIRHQLGLHKKHVVAILGSINEKKGHKEFVDAAIRILQQRDDVTFIIVGVNQEVKLTQFYAQLRETIHRHGMEADILFLDWVSDVQEILPAVTVTAVPSRKEAFGRIAIESMAAGVPVVVTNVGGLKEIVCDRETGLIANAGDAKDLAARTQELLDDPGLRKRLLSNGRRMARQEYGKDAVMDRLEQAYLDTVGKHRRGRFQRP